MRKPKKILSDAQAANNLLDLVALKRYNVLHLEHAKRLRGLLKKISDAPPRLREEMRADIPRIRPSTDASLTAADASGKGPYYAKKLRKLAVYILQHGVLPELRRGKGEIHPTLLNLPEVQEGLRDWSNGLLAVEGGFEGPVRTSFPNVSNRI